MISSIYYIERNIDIGYVLNPCFSAEQRSIILSRLHEAQLDNDTKYMKRLRDFNTINGTFLKKPFAKWEFCYIMDLLDKDEDVLAVLGIKKSACLSKCEKLNLKIELRRKQ